MGLRIDQPIKPTRVTKVQAAEFFSHPALWDGNRIDGKTQKDLVEVMTRETSFLGTFEDGKLVAVTAYRGDSKTRTAEVHTFVHPDHRSLAVEALRGHMQHLYSELGYKFLLTTCSQFNVAVINFLVKRLGFKVYGVYHNNEITRDGIPLKVAKLVADLGSMAGAKAGTTTTKS